MSVCGHNQGRMLTQQAVTTELWFPTVKLVEKEGYNIYLQCTRCEACDNVLFFSPQLFLYMLIIFSEGC